VGGYQPVLRRLSPRTLASGPWGAGIEDRAQCRTALDGMATFAIYGLGLGGCHRWGCSFPFSHRDSLVFRLALVAIGRCSASARRVRRSIT
jgi:hypothetical protein